nr:hypothetical protein [Tanacetum cinerariifolium]
MVNQYGRSFHCLHSLKFPLLRVLNYEVLVRCVDVIQSTTYQQNVLRSLIVSSPLVVLANVVSSTRADRVVTSEATGNSIVKVAGETGKEPDDHLGVRVSSATCWSGTDLELCPILKVLGEASLPFESGPLSSDSSLSKSVPSTSDSLTFVLDLYLLRKDKGDRVITSVTLGDNGMVESDRAVECDEVILVSDGSKASNSSLVRGETGVGSGEVGVWSNDGCVVLAARG